MVELIADIDADHLNGMGLGKGGEEANLIVAEANLALTLLEGEDLLGLAIETAPVVDSVQALLDPLGHVVHVILRNEIQSLHLITQGQGQVVFLGRNENNFSTIVILADLPRNIHTSKLMLQVNIQEEDGISSPIRPAIQELVRVTCHAGQFHGIILNHDIAFNQVR